MSLCINRVLFRDYLKLLSYHLLSHLPRSAELGRSGAARPGGSGLLSSLAANSGHHHPHGQARRHLHPGAPPLRKGMTADPGVLKGLTDMLDRRRIVSGINLCPTSLSVFVCLCVSFSRYLSPSLPRLLLL